MVAKIHAVMRNVNRNFVFQLRTILNLSALTLLWIVLLLPVLLFAQHKTVVIDEHFPELIDDYSLGFTPKAGDTLFIAASRTRPLQFESLVGALGKPIVIINTGGQVHIKATRSNDWGALVFFNSKYIKLSGAGHSRYKYGFLLEAKEAGVAFSELSSDCEAEFVKISHTGFFGIVAKEDYFGNPPIPHPIFKNLSIHDCFIEGVSEGMYLGETVSPGMEFQHVRIYNNIVRNTQRESIQIANMTKDVAIYNNTLINGGLKGLNFQSNNLQIGDNSVAEVYHNIIIGAPAYGIINFGKGEVVLRENYIADSKGIFCDNRRFSEAMAPISITDNYFKKLTGQEVIKNRNENNFLTATENRYDVPIPFYCGVGNSDKVSIANNWLSYIAPVVFEDPDSNNYALAAGTPVEFAQMGAPGGPEYFDTLSTARYTSLPLQIYPNPVKNLLRVKGWQPAAWHVVHIQNLLGRTLVQRRFTEVGHGKNLTLDLHGLPMASGIYILSYRNSAGQQTWVKFVKE